MTISDEEETRIQAMIASDPDNPEWTEAHFAKAKTFAEAFSALAVKAGFSRYDTADYLKTEEDITLYQEAATEDAGDDHV